ncbi:MAG: ribosomal-protein-alanine N-acetyltransferase [Firmicutes bacterium HGW-Firmicutes-20]|nr:MAG: ribosomal-protein-alanine N-acetyltransferase [Firmicutes bacterium HGW-Firmicutes-20]
MIIRAMNEQDIDEVLLLEKELFTAPWNREHFLFELNENPFSLCLVGTVNDRIIAASCAWIIYDRAEISTIGVHKSHQRKGYARTMLDKIHRHAAMNGVHQIFLEVRVSNQPAIALYESYGYKITKVRKNYYSDNHEDAYEMMAEVKKLVR